MAYSKSEIAGIVKNMEDAGESEGNIRAVVAAYDRENAAIQPKAIKRLDVEPQPEAQIKPTPNPYAEYITKDIPAVAKSWYNRAQGRAANIGAPTYAEEATGAKGLLGSFVGTPERLTRAALGAGATLADLGFGATSDLATRAADRWTGGRVSQGVQDIGGAIGEAGRYLPSPIKSGIKSGLGTLSDYYASLSPASQANLKATGYGGEFLSSFMPGARPVTEAVVSGTGLGKGAEILAQGAKATANPETIQKPLRGVGEVLIRPKVSQYVNAAKKDQLTDVFGSTTKEQVKSVSKIIADEGIFGKNKEKMVLAANRKADQLSGAAAQLANDNAIKNGKLELVGNPVENVRTKLEAEIKDGRIRGKTIPAGEQATYLTQLNKILGDLKAYDRPQAEDGIIYFKRDLGPKWVKGPEVAPLDEKIANTIRKAAYYTADDLIKTPGVRALNERASNLYRVSELVDNQKKPGLSPWIKGAAISIPGIEAWKLLKEIPHAPETAIPIAAVAGIEALRRSGKVGDLALTLGNLGVKKEVLPSMAPEWQGLHRKYIKNPNYEAVAEPISETKGYKYKGAK